ncbi:hypothetical protein F5I97DRAFT_961910 [Phlebopus sp. FC_14]|nr:hypothetical protein F5I97DRAFT_961910 [Phlebopus sp. FC_14]
MSPIAALLAPTSTLSTTSPSLTAALYSPPNGGGTSGMNLHVLSTGGIFLFAATIISFAGYFYHAKRRSKTNSGTLHNMFVPHVRSWRSSPSTHTTSDPDGASCVTPSAEGSSQTECLTGGRLGHVAINVEHPLVTGTGSTETFSMGISEVTVTGGLDVQSVGDPGTGTTKTLLDTIREEDEEDEAPAFIDEASQGTLTATFPLSECKARMAEYNQSSTGVDVVSSFFDIGDEDDDAKSEAASEYSTDSASPEHHSSFLGAPLITLTEAPYIHVPMYDVPAKSFDFNIKLIGATIRDGSFLTNPDLLDDWFPPQTFVASPDPAPSPPTSADPIVSSTSSCARRYGMADMSEFAEALSTVEENRIDSSEFIEDARALSLLAYDLRNSQQLEVAKYTETFTVGTCRSACEPKLDMIEEDEEEEAEATVSNHEGADALDFPSAVTMTDSAPNRAEELYVPPCSESESDARSNLAYSTCAESVEELESLLDSLSESEVEFPAAVKPEMDTMFKILQAFRDEQFEWSPRSFTSDSEDGEDSDDDKVQTEVAAVPATPPGRCRSTFKSSHTSSESESDEEVVIMPVTPPTSSLVRPTSPLMIRKRSDSQTFHGLGGDEEQILPLTRLVPKKPFIRGHRHTRSVFELPVIIAE